MPILWRYALHSYLKVFSLSVCTFIFVLIIARFKEIARFTALTGDFGKTGLFIVYQIPAILPIAIPISALIASILLFQRLSKTYELTALRASGLSLWKIVSPILFASIFLSLFNFSMNAELSPYCRREAKTLVYSATSKNPLLLLQRQKLIQLKHAYLSMKAKDDEKAKNFILIVPNLNGGHLSFLSAQRLQMQDDDLIGNNLSIVSFIPTSMGFPRLLIENQKQMSIDAKILSTAIKKKRPKIDVNALNIKMLNFHTRQSQGYIEILRRISLSLAVFSFTFLGASFAIERERNVSKKNLFIILILTLAVLMSYLLGKELKHYPHLAPLVFLFPHPIIWLISSRQLHKIAKGKL